MVIPNPPRLGVIGPRWGFIGKYNLVAIFDDVPLSGNGYYLLRELERKVLVSEGLLRVD